MSVQFDQAPQFTFAQQESLQREYDARAKSPTTAFLLCYFLGVFGAHRIYLGQWGAAALRLLLPLIAIALAILGVLDVLSFATFSLAVITLLCALIWEALDLAHVDREVNAANAALMDRLVTTIPPAISAASPTPEPRPVPRPEPPATPAFTPPPSDASAPVVPLPEPPAPEPASPTPLTFEPEPISPPAPAYPSFPEESAGPSSATPLPPAASAYVPPVAPEVISGGFAVTPAVEPESPPIWPGVDDAPTWPAGGVEPQATAQTDPIPTKSPDTRPVEAAPEPVAAPPPAPAPPQLKHVRVRRKIMLDDGTVVGEQVLEDDFPIAMATQEAAKILEARFQQMTPEEIARRANLPPGTDLQLKRE
jgi:TM2 domain-containing membrane protein YozV